MSRSDPRGIARKRIRSRFLFAAVVPALLLYTQYASRRRSGSSVLGALSFAGLLVIAALVALVVVFAWRRRSDQRVQATDPTALYVGQANVYVGQLANAPKVRNSTAQVRVRRVESLTQGQGVVSGVIRLDQSTISWTPRSVAKSLHRAGPWSVPIEKVKSVEFNALPVFGGKGCIATLKLDSGNDIDVMVNNRNRFSAAWNLAPRRRVSLQSRCALVRVPKCRSRTRRWTSCCRPPSGRQPLRMFSRVGLDDARPGNRDVCQDGAVGGQASVVG